MTPKPSSTKKPTVKNSLTENLKDFESGIFDQLMGNYPDRSDEILHSSETEKNRKTDQKKEFSLFNYQEYYENQIIKRQIKELTEAIKKEIEIIKKSDKSLLSEIKDIQKLAVDSLPDKPGIYHVRFLEIVLNILKALRARVGESRTWMQALLSKKKKRGSLFVVLSKKKGTQYSLSQELSNARSVQ